jgi:hypothetical protein
MKKTIIGIGTVGAFIAMATGAQAAEWTKHFRIGLDAAFNIDATFDQSGMYSVPTQIGAANDTLSGDTAINRDYDDGYVRVDDTGNGGGRTSYWGFTDRSTQYDAAAGTLTMRKATSFTTAGGGTTEEDAPYLGIDAVYGMSTPWRERLSVGWEIGINFMPIDIQDRRSLAATRDETLHVYPTGGMVPPGGGPGGFNNYNGGPSGVGPLLPDMPTASRTQTVAGTLDGSRGLEGNLYTLRLGPMLRWQMTPYWALSGSAGASVAMLHADMKINETMNSVGAPPLTIGARNSDSDLSYGGYIGGVVTYDTGYYWEVFIGAHFVTMTDAELTGGGRRASLSLGSGLHVTAGISWSF